MADYFDPTIINIPKAPRQAKTDYFDPTFQAPQGYQQPSPEVVGVPQPKPKYEANIPVITEAQGMPWKVAIGLLSANDTQQAKDILTNNIPGAKIEQDKYGTDVVNIPNQGKFYIDRPGLDWQDILHTAAQGVSYLGGTMGAAAPFKSLVGRAIGAGVGAGATSAGLDVAAMGAGSEQGINLPRAGRTAAGGALFELGTPLMSSIVRKLFSTGRIPSVQVARQTLQEAGLNPQELTDEAVNVFIKEARTAISPEAAGRFAEAQTLPVSVPLTRGQISGRASEQMFEDMAAKGAFGQGAETLMRGATERTEEALRANIPAIQQRLGGGVVAERGQGAAMAQQALARQAEEAGKGVTQAYEAARGIQGQMPGEVATTMADDIGQSIADFIPHAPTARREFQTLQKLTSKTPAASGLLDSAGNIIHAKKRALDTSIKDLFDWRRKVSTLANNAKDRTEAAALKKMVTQFDDSMDDAIKNSLMSGDEEAAAAWNKAIALRRSKGAKFESGDLISDLVETEYKGGGLRLKVAPEAASNYIFGASNTGFIGRPQLARELTRMKSILGPNSTEWNAIREEAFLRFAQQAEGGFQGAARTFSGAKLKKSIQDIQAKNPEVWRQLFNESERKLINQFANVAARATTPVKGGANFSNTAVGLSRIAQGLNNALFMGPKGKAIISRIFPNIYEGLQLGPAAVSAAGGLARKQIPAGIMGGIGATATTERGRYNQ